MLKSQERFVRHVHDAAELLIEGARTGDHPDDALRLLAYFVMQVQAKESVDPRVLAYLADALADAIRVFPEGASTAANAAFSKLGLIRGREGRPGGAARLSEDENAELTQCIAHQLAAGEKHAKIQAEMANRYGCSEETIRKKVREICTRAGQVVSTRTEVINPLVGVLLDAIDQYAVEIGVDREIIEKIGRLTS
jgi:hypothetical protein